MTELTLRTCAKVNFFLRVLGRRDDGRHNVETILHNVGIWDRLRLRLLPGEEGVRLSVTGGEAPADESNLCYRAARLLADHTRAEHGVAIELEKGIPVGSGLGGGSSDAAATLLGLCRLWGVSPKPRELVELAAALGSDVPFFLRGGCALARGRGELVEPLPDVAAWVVIVVPERRVPTAQAYAALGRGSASGRRRPLSRAGRRAVEAVAAGDLGALAEALHNDFEALRMPAIAEAMEAKAELLAAGCLGAVLSGSGSAVFGIGPDRVSAEQAAARLAKRWPWVREAPTVKAGEGVVISDREEERA